MKRPLQTYLATQSSNPITRSTILESLGWPMSPDPSLWQQHLKTLMNQGLSSVAFAALPAGAEFDEIRDVLRPEAIDRALQAMLLDAATVPVLAELQQRSIPFVVVKGPASGRFYQRAGDRPYTDIDIVVPGALFTKARAALKSVGMSSSDDHSAPWPAFDRWCKEGVNLGRDDGAAIDLHHHIPPWRWGKTLTFERLRAHADHIEIAGVSMPAASAAHHLAISALHLISDAWHRNVPMLTMLDIVHLAQLPGSTAMATELRHLDLDWLVAEVLDHFPEGIIPLEFRSQLRNRGSLAQRFGVASVLPPSMASRHPLGFALRLPTRNMLAFVLGSAVPSPNYLENRFGSRRAYHLWWGLAGRWGIATVAGKDVGSPYAAERDDYVPLHA